MSNKIKEFKVFFPEYNKTVYVLSGTSVFECVTRAKISIKTPCGGAGVCGKCAVKIISGKVAPSMSCIKFFSKKERAEGYRLACRTYIKEDVSLEIPESSLIESDVVALVTADNAINDNITENDCFSKLVTRKNIKLSIPTLDNPMADLNNILQELKGLDINLALLKKIPNFIRKNQFSLSAIISENRLIAFKSLNDVAEFAIAFDIGTTTIAASVLNMQTGKQVASSGILNPQVKFGDDVLSRICYQSESKAKIKEVKRSVIQGCNSLIEELCTVHKIDKNNIYAVSVAGNTVMQTMFCGITTKFLGEIPFIAPFSKTMKFCASELNLTVNSNAEVIIFPVLGGFVGGDITAGLIAIDFYNKKDDGNALFIDVGTNGEIVLKSKGKMYSTAAAAGPAFEGAGIENGMRAANGAIEKILIENGDIIYNVIGDKKPIGICGTALIDLVAELLKCGIIDETGRILAPDECKESILQHFDNADTLLNRIRKDEKNSHVYNFIIAKNAKREKEIRLTQKDVRNLQLASGAIRAAINILMKNANIAENDIDTIYIAGGFGNYIRRSHAKRIGMIPNIENQKIHFIGNTSLIGAKTVLLCQEKLLEAEQIAQNINVIDVSLDVEFQMEFADAMIFPE